MTTAIKRRRGTTAQHATFTGLEGELTVDTTKDTVVVHDGATAGGFPLLKEAAIGVTVQAYDADLTNWAGKTAPTGDAVGTTDTQALTNKTISGASNTLSNIGNSSLTNSAVTIGSTSVSLGATASTVAGLTLTGAAVNGTVGASTPSTGAFTTLSASSTVTLSGGTANGVAYLNGSKVLTTGSALTFDGANKLSIIGSGNAESVIDASAAGSAVLTLLSTSGGNGLIGYGTTGGLRFGSVSGTGGAGFSEQMRLTSTGLGIGTSSPSTKLDIFDSSSPRAALSGPSTASAYYLFRNSTSGLNTGYIGYEFANNAISFATSGAERLRLDSSGNLGLGVTPSAWNGLGTGALQIGSAATSGNIAATAAYLNITSNAYYASGYKYIGSNYATNYAQENGKHVWYTAPSGTAGNAISFTQAMTLDASGNLNLGVNGTALQWSSSGNNCYIAGSSGVMSFATGTGGYSERMRIDSSGNVGIGTSTIAAKLQVYGSSTIGQALFLYNGTSANYIDADLQAFRSGNGSERMRIDSSGNLLVGTTTSTGELVQIIGTAGAGSMKVQVGANGNNGIGFRNASGTAAGSITVNSASVAYNTSSDYRLKENIQPMQNALGVVTQLNPVTYTWKADGSDGQGFIAHELQAVVPDCVTGEKDAVDAEGKPVYQGIDTSFLVATLCKAIQELEARVKQLEGK